MSLNIADKIYIVTEMARLLAEKENTHVYFANCGLQTEVTIKNRISNKCYTFCTQNIYTILGEQVPLTSSNNHIWYYLRNHIYRKYMECKQQGK